MTVHGGSSNAQIRDLTMGTTYEFKVRKKNHPAYFQYVK